MKYYEVKLNPFLRDDLILYAKWEIDFDFKDFPEYFQERGIKTVEQAIIEMNDFWADSPGAYEAFSEHLDFFLKYATVRIHYIYHRTFLYKPGDLTKYLFTKEDGFCIGDCGIKLVDYKDEFEVSSEILEVKEL